ncbi:sensor histidine kinase [Actinophytocola sp.]|uniref:sensor histidine kinase n=1 Tax=Actinophytocola sp. TaxID=1872138 RepID=UPI002D3724CE|nr:sensor histidine kinase [Actinophytocola sp.]HYQ68887.1 sensor histidine kinase [Actinophytocola sp.]
MRSDRWARALHDLYLVTLVIAFVATAVSFPAGTDRLVAGAAVAVLGGVDLVARPRQGIGYFLAAGLAVGLLTTLFPTFAAVAFGLLPLAFVRLPRWAAIVTGVVATGTPYLARPVVQAILAGVGWQPGATIRFGPAYFAVVGIALPVLTALCTAGAVRALNRQSVLAGRAEERQRLAHELHDTLAQGLAGVVLQLEAAEQYLDGRAAQLVTRARETAGACLVDTRRAVAALRPEPLAGTSLVDALRRLCDRCVVRGTVRACHPSVEVVALRVVQEALANAAKHAGATEVTVTAEYEAAALRLVVRDDGRGFDPASVEGGFGLATMRERVASVGGTLSVTSAPGAGTTVTATLEDS